MADAHYLFAFFRDNGQDGVHLASSDDGLEWASINGDRPLLAPRAGTERLMRDPHVTLAPDGVFHLVWTTGWNEPTIGYASSKNLIHWSEQRALSLMAHAPGTRNCWAPELFFDERAGHFLVFWSSTVEGRFPETAGRCEDDYNHRIYHTTTRDFERFSPTRLLYDPGFPVIDATMVRDGSRTVMFVKNETRYPEPAKYIFMTTSDRPLGPYGPPSEPIASDWIEGPSAIKIGDLWHVYFDCYRAKRYGLAVSPDLAHWSNLSDRLHLPGGRALHGCVLAVPAAVVQRLRELPA
ncbi:MAG: glycoside hydrolase family 43 protein [Verrucomicrobia bacterium]|nr:glycoside hydrolase family 43 protein [Verrucomicrobiota bacterium]